MDSTAQPKKWKSALLIWLFIFPAVYLLSLIIFPFLDGYPGILRTLIMTLILVPIMAWWYIPFMNKQFYKWLRK